MTDETQSPATQAMPSAAAVAPPAVQVGGDPAVPSSPPVPASPSAQQDAVGPAGQVASDRPEIIVAGAFAGGFILAMIFKRLGH